MTFITKKNAADELIHIVFYIYSTRLELVPDCTCSWMSLCVYCLFTIHTSSSWIVQDIVLKF